MKKIEPMTKPAPIDKIIISCVNSAIIKEWIMKKVIKKVKLKDNFKRDFFGMVISKYISYLIVTF
jgi:hypothetical protein